MSSASGGEAMGRVVWEDLQEASQGVMRIKQTWRQRFGRWIAGEPDPLVVTMPASISMGNEAIKEKSLSEIDGGTRFRIIQASNGKIIGYFPLGSKGDDSINRMTRQMGESLYVLKEGEDLLGAIAACLALDRLKP